MKTGKQKAEAVAAAVKAIRSRCTDRSYSGITNELVYSTCIKFEVNEDHIRTVAGLPKKCRK